VLATADGALTRDGDGFGASTEVVPGSAPGEGRRAMAVWVSAGEALRPVQALGGWLD
jgi:hypothetical protein